MSSPMWSIIICSINAAKFAQITQCYERLLAGRPFEIISIHDASSLCEGYNRGIAAARGDILVFSHDDILILEQTESPAFASKIEARLASDFDVLGFAGTTQLSDGYWWASGPRHMRGAIAHAGPGARQLSLFVYGVHDQPVERVQAVDGLCMIVHRDALAGLGFDAENFDGFHLYDLDFSFSAHLAGLRVGVMSDIPIVHMSVGAFNEVWQKYRVRFLNKHAVALGLSPDVSIPAPCRISARVANFQSTSELLAVWQPAYLRRATIALLRNTP